MLVPTSKDRAVYLSTLIDGLGHRIQDTGYQSYLRSRGLEVVKEGQLLWGVRAKGHHRLKGLVERFGFTSPGIIPMVECGRWRVVPRHGLSAVINSTNVLDDKLLTDIVELLGRKLVTGNWLGTEVHLNPAGEVKSFTRLPGEITSQGTVVEATPIQKLVKRELTQVDLDFAEAAMRILYP